ncbi:MAG: choice-of-anchor D domain-containing protein [Terriglobales bacterium]
MSHATSPLSTNLVLSRPSMNFGNVVVGSSTQVVESIWNPTSAPVSIATATIEGTDFRIGNASFPLTIAPRQQVALLVTFTAAAAGNSSGSLLISLDGTTPYVTVPLYGTGVIPGQLAASPASISFAGGAGQRIPETVTNSGATNIWLETATTTGTGFTLSGSPLPVLLKPGQSATFIVSMPSTGNVSGSIQFNGMLRWWTSGERGAYQSAITAPAKISLVIPVSGTSAVAGQLTPAPSTISFGNVQTGNTQTLPATLTNSGAGPVAITTATATGSGFGISGLPLPMTLAPSESVTFSASFTPQSSGNAQGKISVISNASNSTVNLALSGSANAPGQLALSPASLNFGNVIVGKSQQLTASLAASGSAVTVSSASFSGSEYSLSGIQLPVTIPAGQSAAFTVIFAPQTSGAATASLSFGGTAPATVESLTGAGTAPPQHSVALSWSADSSTVAGYNVYRGTQTGGPYAKLTSAPAPSTNYGDTAVTAGQTYFYVTTAVDSSGAESAHSNEVQAAIPSP